MRKVIEMKKWQKEAYDLGAKLAGKSIEDIIYNDLAPAHYWTDFEMNAFFDHGYHGLPFPEYVTGWRWGKIPPSGQSYNYRDNIAEHGVSVMEVYSTDGAISTIDKVSAMFCASGRSRVEVAGYLNGLRRGSDGEPLLICAKVIQ